MLFAIGLMSWRKLCAVALASRHRPRHSEADCVAQQGPSLCASTLDGRSPGNWGLLLIADLPLRNVLGDIRPNETCAPADELIRDLESSIDAVEVIDGLAEASAD